MAKRMSDGHEFRLMVELQSQGDDGEWARDKDLPGAFTCLFAGDIGECAETLSNAREAAGWKV